MQAERNIPPMKTHSRNILLLVAAAASMLLLSGCGAGAQTQAITDAVVAYSDYYIEVRNLSDQVVAQSSQSGSSNQSSNYTITVDIPDYSVMDPATAGFTMPEPSISSRSANAYKKQAALALRQSLEQYALQNGANAYIHLPVSFTVTSRNGSLAANLTSQSKLDIQKTVDDLILGVLLQSDTYRNDLLLMQISSALPGLLTDAFGGEEYAQSIEITDVSSTEDGNYTASFTYPDATYVFNALGDLYIASFNQPFYGDVRTVSLSTEEMSKIDIASAPQQTGKVTLSFDSETEQCTLLDDGGLAALITEAKAQAKTTASEGVNTKWRVPPIEAPSSGTILEGESDGNQIVFKTGSSLGKYYYVRFYAISGEDTSEEGTLQLGAFIVGGKSAKLRLPSGYYRVNCVVGDNWYGLDNLFGSDVKTYNGGNAIQSRKGYVNTISFQ